MSVTISEIFRTTNALILITMTLPLLVAPLWASVVSQMVKNSPAVQTWVLSLSREEPLEKGMATYSSVLSWRIPWMEEPGGL